LSVSFGVCETQKRGRLKKNQEPPYRDIKVGFVRF